MRLNRGGLLDGATIALLVVSIGLFTNERVIPALAELDRLEPGDRLQRPIALRSLATGDRLAVRGERPTVLVVFQSTCDVCERTAPIWSSLAERFPGSILAVGLEPDGPARKWAETRLPEVQIVAPREPSAFVDRLRIRAVPSTFLIARGRVLLARRGPLSSRDVTLVERVLTGSGAHPARRPTSRIEEVP